MTTLYLHIGMPKTGTTYIQNFLKQNEKVLNSKGYAYPIFYTRFEKKDRARNGYFLKHKYYNNQGIRDTEREKLMVDRHFERLVRIAKKYDNIILSEESLWNDSKFSWKNLKLRTDLAGFKVKIIVYLRRQDSYIQSYWAQMVQIKYTMSFDEYINNAGYNNICLDYYKKLNKLSTVFGKENIIVRAYEKSSFSGNKNTLSSDFLEVIGLEETDDFVPINCLMNVSLSGIYLDIKRRLNRNSEIAVQKGFASKLLIALMLENNDLVDYNESQLFTYNNQKKFLGLFKKNNRMVAEEFFDRKELFNEKPIKSNNRKKSYSTDDLIDICGRMLVTQNEEILKLKNELKNKEKTIKSLMSD